MNFADSAHSMKVALVLFVALGAVVLAEAFLTPTPTPTPKPKPPPCPKSCPPSPRYVCARDRRGNVYRFLNGCYMQKCACKMWLQPVSECSRDAPGCPVKDASDDSSDSSSSSSDSSSSSSDSHDDDGHGHGHGHGDGHGHGHGHGHGDGYGDVYGDVYGDGHSYGDVYGDGYNHGQGHPLDYVQEDTESIKKQAQHIH